MTTTSSDRIVYRPAEAAHAIGISRAGLYRLVAAGEIELVHLSEHVSVIPVASLHALIERRRQQAQDAQP